MHSAKVSDYFYRTYTKSCKAELLLRERDRERQTDRERYRQRKIQTERKRETDRERENKS